jgi:hypothetical protein
MLLPYTYIFVQDLVWFVKIYVLFQYFPTIYNVYRNLSLGYCFNKKIQTIPSH